MAPSGPPPSSGRLEPTNTGTPIRDRKSTRLNSSHSQISYAVFCLKKKKKKKEISRLTDTFDRIVKRPCMGRVQASLVISWWGEQVVRGEFTRKYTCYVILFDMCVS